MSDVFVDVPGGSLYAEDSGAPASDAGGAGGREPILLLHAGVTDSRVWDETAPRLAAAGYRTIRFDGRGYGRSPLSEQPFSHVADALAVLDAHGVDSAHFVGLSQGAATSVDTAIAHPARVRTLALVAPGLSGFVWPQLPGYERRVAAAERDDPQGLALEHARLWASMSFDGGDGDDKAARIVRDQAGAFWAEELEVEEPDAIPRLGEIRVPTLVVLGDRDLEVITEIGNLLASAIAGARLTTLAGADHILPLRVPDALHEALAGHLKPT
jgi:3-oxoadipate enol-lactonase